ncbi:hypothetical protein JHK87_042618 [Glycine soja]|nr:hypothetical protein JHK87_042618 [Glycine soja]
MECQHMARQLGPKSERRNLWVFENKKQHLQQTLAVAESLSLQTTTSSDQNQSQQEVKWIPPPNHYIKGNFDISLKDKRGTGFGVIFRDNLGNVLAAATHFCPRNFSFVLDGL